MFSSNPFDDSQVYEAAESKLNEAAAQSDLREQAKDNTEKWLRTFLGAAGFDSVEVEWRESPS